jgi:molybdopterin-binding protein
MASDSANLSTFAFGSSSVAIAKVNAITFGGSAAEIDVSALTDTSKKLIAGQTNNKVSVELFGNAASSFAVGSTGGVTVAWNDGTTSSITKAMVTSLEIKGGVDQPISTSVSLSPTP